MKGGDNLNNPVLGLQATTPSTPTSIGAPEKGSHKSWVCGFTNHSHKSIGC